MALTTGRRKKLRRFLVLGVAPVLALTAASFSANPAEAKDPGAPNPTNRPGLSDKASYYDVRNDPANAKALRTKAAQQSAKPKFGVAALRKELGTQGIVSIDPLTGTARSVSRLNGFLTGASNRPAADIARDYVRSHPDVFGLDAVGMSRLTLRRDYVDIGGIHHLSFIQSVDGIPVFNNGVQANVAKDGRLVNVVGSPVAALPSAAGVPGISADKARVAATAGVEATAKPAKATVQGGARRTTTFSTGERAELAYFQTLGGLRLAWQTLTMPNNKEMYTSIVDAESGKVLYRRSLVENDNGLAWDNYPGAAAGGVQRSHDFTNAGWLPNDSPRLAGNVAHVYNDANDDNTAQPTEEVTPCRPRSWTGRTPRAACPTPTTRTTPTWRPRRTARSRGCRCTCSPTRPTRPTRSSPATAGTRRTWSTTSTPTACPTGSSSTPWATRRWAKSRPVPWVRRGATGTP